MYSARKGTTRQGNFTPSKEASKLSKAPIFSNHSTPLIMRYSTDTGLKNLPDNGENGSRGFAIRFVLSDDGHKHYDIITNNAFGFVVSTGEGFLDQFKAMRDGKMDEFLEKYPHAKYFNENQAPAHAVSSFPPLMKLITKLCPVLICNRAMAQYACIQIHQRRRQKAILPLENRPLARRNEAQQSRRI